MKSLSQVIGIISVLCVSIASAEERMVQIDVRYVAYPEAKINELLEKDITKQLSVEDLSLLLEQGDGRIISSQSLVTRDRAEALIRDADTHRIARDVAVEIIKLTSETNTPVAAVARPQDFEVIDVGINVKITPTISETGESIVLEVQAQYIEHIEILPRAIGAVHSDKGDLNLTTEHAVIKQHQILTMISIRDGETLLLGGGTKTKDDEDVYVFLSCKILCIGGNDSVEQ